MGRKEKDLKLQERRQVIDQRSHSGNEGKRMETSKRTKWVREEGTEW